MELVYFVELGVTLCHIYMSPLTLHVFLFYVVTYLITVTANIADCLPGSAAWYQAHENTKE